MENPPVEIGWYWTWNEEEKAAGRLNPVVHYIEGPPVTMYPCPGVRWWSVRLDGPGDVPVIAPDERWAL